MRMQMASLLKTKTQACNTCENTFASIALIRANVLRKEKPENEKSLGLKYKEFNWPWSATYCACVCPNAYVASEN